MIYKLDRESHIPLYIQLAGQVRKMINDGRLKIGDPLPTTRELAERLEVNRNTVISAYAELTADGLINSHVGRGTYVCGVPEVRSTASSNTIPTPPSPMPWASLLGEQRRDDWLERMSATALNKELISFAYALPATPLFPLEGFRRSLDRIMRKEGRTLLQLGASNGYAPLQEYLAKQMALLGCQVRTDEIVITNGCQQALDLIRRMLVGPGDEIIIENPTYPGAISIFCNNETRFLTVPVKENGIDLDVLADILAQRRPKLIYTIPSFQNPTSASIDLSARYRLLELSAKYRVPIIEDDIYRDLRYEGNVLPPLKALDEYGLVIYINSFSKIGFPGLRVGWLAAPRIVAEHINSLKQRTDLHTNLIAQAALYEFSKHGLLINHIKRVRKIYAQNRNTMLASLQRHFPEELSWNNPPGGMAIWVKMPSQLKSLELLSKADEKGVTFSPGEFFFAGPPQANYFRLSFTMCEPQRIDEGIKSLSGVIKDQLVKFKKQQVIKKGSTRQALV